MEKSSKSIFPLSMYTYFFREQLFRPHMDFHKHFTIELYYLLEGKSTISYKSPTGYENIELYSGQYALIKPNTEHCINTDSHVKQFCLELGMSDHAKDIIEYLRRSEYVLSFDASQKLMSEWADVLVLNDTQNLPVTLHKFNNLTTAAKDCFYNGNMEIYAKTLFLDILKCFNDKYVSGYNIHIKRAFAYLSSNFNKPLSPADVAQYLKISTTHFQRIFKEATGNTFNQALNEMRISYSRELLIKSNYSISKIASMVGYNTSLSFETNFKKHMKTSASEYRTHEEKNDVCFVKVDRDYKLIEPDITDC